MQPGFWLFLFLAILVSGCSTTSPTSGVRLNQIQVIGSHNSYHVRAHDSLRAVLASRSPETAQALDYTHPPLTDQFSRLGIRQIELDCFADPDGGLYAHPKGVEWVKRAGLPPVPNHDPEGRLRQPGFKVMHVPDIDYFSTVPTLRVALQQVFDWSEQHPGHIPIFILLELKKMPRARISLNPSGWAKKS